MAASHQVKLRDLEAAGDPELPPKPASPFCVLVKRLCFASKRANGLLVVCFAMWIFIMVTTFGPQPLGLMVNGTVCPRPTVCALEWYTLLLLAVSRGSAYATYPIMILLFLSKANNLRSWLQRSCFSIFVPFHDLHHVHVIGGHIVGIAVAIHGLAHFTRWASQGNLAFLWTHVTGRSGVISLLLTPLIVLPMRWAKLRKQIRWELRKALHYLSIVWCFSICFHAPLQHIAWIMGVPLAIYLLDVMYGTLFRTHLIESPTFTRLESAVQLSFKNPAAGGFGNAGYVLVNVPWLAKGEWHAFSLFRHPTLPDHSCVCMNVGGDWTRALHEATRLPTHRPCWVSGPFASPYSTAINYDNLILIASGIGITPALSILHAHQRTRRINLIWMCRDASLLEFYLHAYDFDPHAWTLIFYTGKRQLAVRNLRLPKTVVVLPGRPQLEEVICELISGIEDGGGLPEAVLAEAEAHLEAMRQLDARMRGEGTDDTDTPQGAPVSPLLRFALLLTHVLRALTPGEVRELLASTSKGTGANGAGAEDTPTTDLPSLCAVVTDTLQDAYGENDMRALGEAIGCSDEAFMELRVPATKLKSGDIEGFGMELLELLERTADANEPSMPPPSTPIQAHVAAPSSDFKFVSRLSFATPTEATRLALLHEGSDVLVVESDFEDDMPEITEHEALATDEDGAHELKSIPASDEGKSVKSVKIARSVKFRQSLDVGAVRGRVASRMAVASSARRHRLTQTGRAMRADSQSHGTYGWWLSATARDAPQYQTLQKATTAFSLGASSGETIVARLAAGGRLRTWQMLYCGGAQPVVDSLQAISRKHGIKLRVEKFDW